jgi:hypothetical protein
MYVLIRSALYELLFLFITSRYTFVGLSLQKKESFPYKHFIIYPTKDF